MSVCPHDDDPQTCPPCQIAAHGDDYRTTATKQYGAQTTARYEGHCPACETTIAVGQRITAAEQGWQHATC